MFVPIKPTFRPCCGNLLGVLPSGYSSGSLDYAVVEAEVVRPPKVCREMALLSISEGFGP